VQGLSEATVRIGDVVHLISKGFAVVAGEVKTPAAQTAKADLGNCHGDRDGADRDR
jgi:hypothetical protein